MSNRFNEWMCATHAERVQMHQDDADRQHAAMLEAQERSDQCRQHDENEYAKVETKRAAAHRGAWRAHLAALEDEKKNAACAAACEAADSSPSPRAQE